MAACHDGQAVTVRAGTRTTARVNRMSSQIGVFMNDASTPSIVAGRGTGARGLASVGRQPVGETLLSRDPVSVGGTLLSRRAARDTPVSPTDARDRSVSPTDVFPL